MATVTPSSTKGSIVAQAYALMAAADRADKKAAKAKEPAPVPAKPAAKKKGRRK